jgi:outer membrane protein assembly factor BamB
LVATALVAGVLLAQSWPAMFTKVYPVLISILILATSCGKDVAESNALNAVPIRSAFVVRVNNLAALVNNAEASVPGAALQQSFVFENLNSFARLLGNLAEGQVPNIKGYGAYHLSGASSYGWLWCMEEGEFAFVDREKLKTKGKLASREYAGSEIIHFTSDSLDFYFARQNGLVLLSKHQNLVQEGLKQLQSKIGLQASSTFAAVHKTANFKDPINVFIQFSALPDWLASILTQKADWPEHFATWAALDLDINTNDVNLTGVALVPDSAATYLGTFAKAGKSNAQFASVVPLDAALVVNQNCGDINAWYKAFEAYLGVQNRLKKRSVRLEELHVVPKEWLDFLTGEMGVYYADGALPGAASKCAYFRISDIEKARIAMQKASGAFVENYRDVAIGQVDKRLFLPLLFGHLFSEMPTPYWFIQGEWLVCCNDLGVAKSHINSVLSERTLGTSSGGGVNKTTGSSAQIIVLARNPEYLNLIQKELNVEVQKEFKKQQEKLAAISWLSIELKVDGDVAFTEIVFAHEEQVQQESARQQWGVTLEAPARMRPQLLKNHVNNQNEVIVQDERNNLYLINAKGEVLWKKAADGAILGPIEQIDIFKNNKLQLIFNTASHLYVVDRNGNDVAPFPLKLPDQATAPMAALDYSNNRDYRVLVPCGRRLYNYTLDGKQVKGWDFGKAKNSLVTQPKHRAIAGKDYIYLADEAGSVYVLDRQGRIRKKLKNRLQGSASALYLQGKTESEALILSLGKSGYQRKLYLNDNLDSVQPFRKEPRYLVAERDNLLFAANYQLYLRAGNATADIDLDGDLSGEPGIFSTNKQLFVAATLSENVWVFNEEGEALPGMPLYGNGFVMIGNLHGKAVMCVSATHDGGLVAYKLTEE